MDNYRPVLYISLVFVLFLLWQAWQQDYVWPTQEPMAASGSSMTAEPTTDTPRLDVPDAPTAEAGQLPTGVPTDAVPVRETVRVVTDVLDLEIDTRGGSIVRADLPTYPVSLEEPDRPMRLLDEQVRQFVAQSGLIHDRVADVDAERRAPSHHAVYRAEKTEYRLADGVDELRVPLIWTDGSGVTVTKTFVLRRGHFLVDVEHHVDNASDAAWVGRQYRQLRHGPTPDRESYFIYTFTGAAYYDGRYEKLAFDDMVKKPIDREVQGGWVSVIQHYFVTAWIPVADETSLFYTRVLGTAGRPEHIIGMRSGAQTAAPGERASFTSSIWVGPKLQNELEDVAKGLELTADYGIFAFLAKPIFWLLSFIHGLVGNWGWSIIILTVMIKLAFYKLSATSYRSMAKMRAVQPKLQALKERFGDDKQRMQQALMELYKKEKINPLGGCLPILIQIPVFIALYWVLLESVEMRQAPWILWINDLSTKDPYFVLPVLMGITMIVQHRLNPAPLDPVQQKLMMILPFVFTIFFAFFQAGLVLYWFVNNLLSIAQQWKITRAIAAETK
ncbi:MAG: membrane protein insertase YidC [Chromatiales bacterium]|jgi:YidC/Oxa1 family membrane protein insertase|nr:membrane protein insertase YidC [Chromatiales bacterium]MDX9767025.1 membrane protein insertase YidC [Ectothiorhodospiraceae bacterium]